MEGTRYGDVDAGRHDVGQAIKGKGALMRDRATIVRPDRVLPARLRGGNLEKLAPPPGLAEEPEAGAFGPEFFGGVAVEIQADGRPARGTPEGKPVRGPFEVPNALKGRRDGD